MWIIFIHWRTLNSQSSLFTQIKASFLAILYQLVMALTYTCTAHILTYHTESYILEHKWTCCYRKIVSIKWFVPLILQKPGNNLIFKQ